MTTSKSPKPLDRLKTRAAVYARYSSDMQSEASADDQIARIQYRLEHGQIRSQKYIGRIVELAPEWILKDEAQSGRLAGRASYERIIDGIRRKAFDLLIVDDLSRLTRSLGNLLELYDMLRWYEVELISVCDGISSEDASAKTFFTVKGMVNDFSNDIHAERVIRGMEMRVLQGLSCGDYPYGYDSNPTKLENSKGRPFPSHYKITVNESEAQIVRRIFSMYDIGLGFTRIAKALNADNIPSPGVQFTRLSRQPIWSPRSAQHILQNEKYIGIWKWKKTKVGVHPETRLRAAKDRPATEWVSHLAGKDNREDLRIIEPELWDRVSAKFAENRKLPTDARARGRWTNRKSILPEHPFSGVMECGVCASNFMLIGGKNGGYYGCFSAHKQGTCTNKQLIRIDRLESTLVGVIREKLDQPEILDYAVKRYNKAVQAKLSTAPARMEQIRQESDAVEGELKNLLQFVMTGNSSETITLAIRDREQRKARLISELGMLRKAQPKLSGISEQDIQTRLTGLAEAIRQNPIECYPAIRGLFPKKVRLIPNGKAFDGHSLYSMKGQILLNGALGQDFDRTSRNTKTKGEADKTLPLPDSSFFSSRTRPCDSKGQGFSAHENGVFLGN